MKHFMDNIAYQRHRIKIFSDDKKIYKEFAVITTRKQTNSPMEGGQRMHIREEIHMKSTYLQSMDG